MQVSKKYYWNLTFRRGLPQPPDDIVEPVFAEVDDEDMESSSGGDSPEAHGSVNLAASRDDRGIHEPRGLSPVERLSSCEEDGRREVESSADEDEDNHSFDGSEFRNENEHEDYSMGDGQDEEMEFESSANEDEVNSSSDGSERRHDSVNGIDSNDDSRDSFISGDSAELDEGDHNEDEEDPYNAQIPGDIDGQEYRSLYRGAPVTVGQSMLLILTLMLRHNLNMLCIADIIAVINLHCLQDGLKRNCLPSFQKFFSLNETSMKKHFYCSKCLRDLRSGNDQCPSCPTAKSSYFIGLSFIDQLKEMYQRENFHDLLSQHLHHPVRPDGSISDIYDGALYKEWMANGFLANPNNISFSWYTDGVPVFKSSETGVWPIYLTINELPFEERKKIENTLLVGLWFGDQKPAANSFVYKFRSQFEKIAEGLDIHLRENQTIRVRGILLMGTCDMQAKSLFLNMTQYNGLHGCPACYCPGESVAINLTSHVYAYQYEPNPQLRTLQECEAYANTATPDVPIMGIKGPNAFSRIMPDYIRGMAIDRMHGIEGGVVKKILKLLFNVQFRAFPFSLYNFKQLIDTRLIAIKPPKSVHRMPRSIDDLVHWKASELKMWFFHYSIPVLEGITRNDYFQHYVMLVAAISLLNGDIVTLQMLQIAKDFLHKWVREFQQLYGLRFCSINIHQLLHLPDKVYQLGPLWVHSCFQYEDLNGKFVKLVHGTWHLDTQIAKKHEQIVAMVRHVERLPDGQIRNFCLSKKRQVKILENIFPQTYSVGTYKTLIAVPDVISDALRRAGYEQWVSIAQYLRLLKDKILYVSKEYPRTLQTSSYIVKYTELDGNSSFGAVSTFVKLTPQCHCGGDCRCRDTHAAIINKIHTDDVFLVRGEEHTYSTNTLLRKCHVTDEVKAIDIGSLDSVCIHMDIEDQLYVGIPVNKKDLE